MYLEKYRWQDRVIRPYWWTVELGITVFAFALLGGASLIEAPVGQDAYQIRTAGFSVPARATTTNPPMQSGQPDSAEPHLERKCYG